MPESLSINTLAGASSLVNAPIDYGLSFVTDFQFGQVESYRASTPGEQSAMYGMTAQTTATASAGAASNENYRSAAGLPAENAGRFVLEGILNNTRGVTFRPALPGAGGPGGLPELVIPNAAKQVTVTRVSGVTPPF